MDDRIGESQTAVDESVWSAEFLAGYNLAWVAGNCPPHLARVVCILEPDHDVIYPESGRFIQDISEPTTPVFYEGIVRQRAIDMYGLAASTNAISWDYPRYYAQGLLAHDRAHEIRRSLAESASGLRPDASSHGDEGERRQLEAELAGLKRYMSTVVQPARDNWLEARVGYVARHHSGRIVVTGHPDHVDAGVISRFGDLTVAVLSPIVVPASLVAPEDRYALTPEQRAALHKIANEPSLYDDPLADLRASY